MKIVRLPIGQIASETCDCIQIQELPGGRHQLFGAALLQCGDSNEAESVSISSEHSYASYDDAEAAGLAWASEHCVDEIHVARSNGLEELPDIFDSNRS